MSRTSPWALVLSRWLREDRLALVVTLFTLILQIGIAARMLVPGELAGDDNSIHLAEIAGISRSLSAGELDLWNPSANGGFASGYFYQFLPQLACAIFYLLFGWIFSLSTVFKLTIIGALIATPLTVTRALRVAGLRPIAAAAGGLGASTVFAVSTWGAGIDSLFSTGLYTQVFATAFYPLAIAYSAKFILRGKNYGRAIVYTLLTGFCHPFIAVAIAPALVFLPWWTVRVKDLAIRGGVLFAGALFGAAPLWLPIIVHYDAFGGFPQRVSGEEGIPAGPFLNDFYRGAFLDVSRRAVTTVLLLVCMPVMLLREGRRTIPLYLAGFCFAAMIMLGPVVGKTEGDLLPAVRFLAPMQMFLGAAAFSAAAIGAIWLLRFAKTRFNDRAVYGAALTIVVLLASFCTLELVRGVDKRAEARVRTVHSFKKIRRAELGKIIDFLETQPRGRVFAASEFGSGSHWWMYLHYVEIDRPAVRAYGGAALQSSPNYVFLRAGNLVRMQDIFSTRYVLATVDYAEKRRRADFEALGGRIIYESGGYRVYELRDPSLFRAVTSLGVVTGNRKKKTKAIQKWLDKPTASGKTTMTERDLGEHAEPSDVTISESRHSRRRHTAALTVRGDKPALLRLAVTFHPGWQATVDGKPVEVERVAPAMVAILVPPGEHTVEFEFSRPLWTWMLYLLLFAAIGGYVFWSRRRLAAAAAVALFVIASPRSAQAQSAFPTPVDIAFGKDGRAVIATTAGLLVRKRAGEPFAFVCPDESGSRPGAFSPRVAIRGGGAFAATSYRGLRESGDGCAFELAAVIGADEALVEKSLWFSDVTAGKDDELWAATADSKSHNDVYYSAGYRLAMRTADLSSDRFWYISVALTPAANRMYASGYMVAGRAEGEIIKLLIVDDQVAPAVGLEAGRSGRIRVALAPTDREVFAVAEGAVEPGGDALFYSSDAASNFVEVFRSTGPIVGVVRDQDGATWVATTTEVLRSNVGETELAPTAKMQLSCLVTDASGDIYACHANSATSGVIVSRLAYSGGKLSASPIVHNAEIGAPCGAAAGRCAESWKRVCVALGADCASKPTTPLAPPTSSLPPPMNDNPIGFLVPILLIVALVALSIVVFALKR